MKKDDNQGSMMMNKIIAITVFLFIIVTADIFGQAKKTDANIPFIVEIRNVTVNGGLIIFGYYSSQEAFSNQSPDWSTTIEPTNETILYKINVPAGEYLIGIHQDSNGNGVMDYALFGIPKEPYGFSNMKGKKPGNFNQLKFKVNNSNEKIIIPLVRF